MMKMQMVVEYIHECQTLNKEIIHRYKNTSGGHLQMQ